MPVTRRRDVAHGVRATITPTVQANVAAGHVAGWIGVGGPGQGAAARRCWLQVGVASMPDTPAMIYAEITRSGKDPVFVHSSSGVAVGESHHVAVMEMSGRPNYWRVWLDGDRRDQADSARELHETVAPDRNR